MEKVENSVKTFSSLLQTSAKQKREFLGRRNGLLINGIGVIYVEHYGNWDIRIFQHVDLLKNMRMEFIQEKR